MCERQRKKTIGNVFDTITRNSKFVFICRNAAFLGDKKAQFCCCDLISFLGACYLLGKK